MFIWGNFKCFYVCFFMAVFVIWHILILIAAYRLPCFSHLRKCSIILKNILHVWKGFPRGLVWCHQRFTFTNPIHGIARLLKPCSHWPGIKFRYVSVLTPSGTATVATPGRTALTIVTTRPFPYFRKIYFRRNRRGVPIAALNRDKPRWTGKHCN